jgi:NAD(P)-dependent dehydrogenase (short-subunit alcohol dehydrogenase family)
VSEKDSLPTRLFSLKGKTALVTGGARGIGLTYARVLAGAGADVMLADLLEDKAKESAAGLSKEFGVKSFGIRADVTDPSSCAAMVEETVKLLGGLDIGVANAGIAMPGVSIMEHTAEQWDRVYAVNVKGVFLSDQAFGRVMLKQGRGGRIVNMCSMTATVVSVHPYGTGGSYASSKAAVKHLTKAFAIELAPGDITVNSISPGWIRTEMTQHYWDDPAMGGEKIGRTPLRRAGEVSELEGMMLYLASDASSFMTGTDVIIDGGFSIP